MPTRRLGVICHGDVCERQWFSTTRARNTAWMRFRRAKQVPSAGTLRGRVQDAGVLGHHEDLLLSYRDISERGKEGQIRFAAKQQEQVFAVEWEVCGYEDHWVVLWGTGKRVSLLSVRGPGPAQGRGEQGCRTVGP